MCGRYTLTQAGAVPDLFEISELRITPRFNVAPSQELPIIRLDSAGRREGALLRWGLIPHWMKEKPTGSPMINARAEGLDTKPAYRAAFKYRRCLVPADGFFEWKKVPGRKRKQPYFFQLHDRALFAFAGLWEHFEKEGEIIESFTILTCDANDLVGKVHDRMPVILPRNGYAAWLGSGTEPDVRHRLLAPFDPDRMESYPVSPRVNSPANDDETCIEPWSPDASP
jgi:putative SOS response-associated peptidase YedK